MKPLFKAFCSALNVIQYNTDQCIDVSLSQTCTVCLTKNLIFSVASSCMHSCYQSADIIQYTEVLNIIVIINEHNYNNYSCQI